MLAASAAISYVTYMETIHQSFVFDCPAHAFYDTFLSGEDLSEVTGSPASIEPYEGGIYAAFNGEIQGWLTRLHDDQEIAFDWRSTMEDWPEDHFAHARLELFQSSDGTTVEIEMTDVPTAFAPAIEAGWQELFWEPLQRHFAW